MPKCWLWHACIATVYAMIKSQVPLRTIAKHRRRKTKVTLPTCGAIIHA